MHTRLTWLRKWCSCELQRITHGLKTTSTARARSPRWSAVSLTLLTSIGILNPDALRPSLATSTGLSACKTICARRESQNTVKDVDMQGDTGKTGSDWRWIFLCEYGYVPHLLFKYGNSPKISVFQKGPARLFFMPVFSALTGVVYYTAHVLWFQDLKGNFW